MADSEKDKKYKGYMLTYALTNGIITYMLVTKILITAFFKTHQFLGKFWKSNSYTSRV